MGRIELTTEAERRIARAVKFWESRNFQQQHSMPLARASSGLAVGQITSTVEYQKAGQFKFCVLTPSSGTDFDPASPSKTYTWTAAGDAFPILAPALRPGYEIAEDEFCLVGNIGVCWIVLMTFNCPTES